MSNALPPTSGKCHEKVYPIAKAVFAVLPAKHDGIEAQLV